MKNAAHAKRRGARLTTMRRASYEKIKADIAKKGRSKLPKEPALIDATDIVVVSNAHHADKYDPKYAGFAREMCRLGATDMEVARGLGVSLSVVWRWQAKYEEFFKACVESKDFCDERVERSLYQRAVGYSYPNVKIFNNNGEPVVVPYIEHIIPDVAAQKHWLRARRREQWGDKQELNLKGDESFNEMWHAICTGQILPLLANPSSLGGGGDENKCEEDGES